MFNNFSTGALYGFIAAGIIGIILNQLRESRGKMGQKHRTFDTFSDSEQPKLTSNKVFWESFWGMIGCAFWTLILFGMIYIIFRLGKEIPNW